MPTTRRRYTKREKATVVIAAEMSTVSAAAEAHGINESTVRYWMEDPRFASLREKTREEASGGFTVLMHLAQERLARLVPEMEPRDLIVLLGVATDKGELLGGRATARTENVSITDGLDDHEKDALREAIMGELARRSDERTTVPAVGPSGPEGTEGT